MHGYSIFVRSLVPILTCEVKSSKFSWGSMPPEPPRWLMFLGPEAWAPSLLQGILRGCVCHVAILSLFYCHNGTLSLSTLLSHCLTLLSFCPRLSYCLAVIMSTVMLSHCLTVSFLYCPTVLLSLSHTAPLSFCLYVTCTVTVSL